MSSAEAARTGYRLDGRVALVTGAGSGIGAAIARRLAAEGATVVLADRDQQSVESVAHELGGQAAAVVGDVSSEQDQDRMVSTAIAQFGALDIAVNNAGIPSVTASVDEYPLDHWQKILDVNVSGVFLGMRAQLGLMQDAGRGSIINIASVAGFIAFPQTPAYVASKHAVVGLTRAAAVDAGSRGVRVNAIAPGIIETPLFEARVGGDEAKIARLVGQQALPRLGRAEDIAAAAAFLASDDASFVTGSVLTVDGGFLAL